MSSTRSRSRPAPAIEAGPDGSLLLVGHGSSFLTCATDVLREQAARLWAGQAFGAVAAGFLKGGPNLDEALEALPAGTVYVVPFFMGEGYFTKVAVPKRLALTGPVTVREAPGRRWRLCYCAPVGCNPDLFALISARARRVCVSEKLEPRRTTLVLAGHGNRRSSDAAAMLRRHAARILAKRSFASVRTAFIEEPPFIPTVLAELDGRDAIVIGVLAGYGQHAVDDVPGMVAHEKARRVAGGASRGALVEAGIIGSDPAMATLVVAQTQAFDRGEAGEIAASTTRTQPSGVSA